MTDLDFINRPLTIKNPPDFTVVSTFAGCGGSSTGYVWAGGKVLLAVEWDNNAVETYRLNYPDTDIYHGDIAKITVQDILDRTGLQPGELDIFDGSPPCQGFSTTGKRMIEDPRNQLFREYVRLLQGLQPKVFVMENVSGMVKGKMKLLFADILTELRNSGYTVSAKLLNAMYLGVPQSRQRMIFIGVRDDLGIEPSHPKPQTRPIPVRDAIGNLEKTRPDLELNDHAKTIYRKRKLGSKDNFNSIVLKGNCVAPTLIKTQRPTASTGLNHYSLEQSLSIEELQRIGSFPDCYCFTGAYSTQAARIGNSVPPEMMRRIALHIKEKILDKIS